MISFDVIMYIGIFIVYPIVIALLGFIVHYISKLLNKNGKQ
jgi:hypothetical protein